MGWYEAVKDALVVADTLRNAELKQRLVDVQTECVKLAEENVKLRQDLLELREQTSTRQEMSYRDNVYWRQVGEGKEEGPFCPKCLDGSKKVARMSERANDDFWRCTVCAFSMRRPGREQRTIHVATDF